jgi:hypothetical protein
MQALSQAFAKSFDAVRRILLGRDAKLVLLRETETAAQYKTLAVIDAGWNMPDFNDYFGTQSFYVADLSQAFANKVRRITHLVIVNSIIPALNDQLYELTPETAPPGGLRPYWTLMAKSISKRFVPSMEVEP